MATRKQAAQDFVKTWSSDKKGREDADRQTFWNDLLQRVYGINNYYDYITYEKDVQVKADGKVTTRRIDGYIPSTKVMIEMKGKEVNDLTKPLSQSGGDELTPYEQAKRYANFLPANEYPRWIIVSNFNEIDIHNMNEPLGEPTRIMLKDLPNKFKSLEFLVDVNQQQIIDEKQLSVDAGNLVAKIYNSLSDAYAKGDGIDINDERIQKSLNMLIVRLVFLLYADDTGILGDTNIFQNFLERRTPQDIRAGLIDLFKVLDQDPEKGQRDPFISDEYKQFSYVNGGMFSDENIIIPQFTPELKELIVNEAGKGFNWSNISPTIFGAVFESTLNPDTRRSGGMHYTSIENIHKVIDPLFLNDLHDEFDKIQNMGNRKQRITRAKEFQEKLGKLKFLDPACGSGNFLTETYLSLRKMENQCLQIIYGNQPILATEALVKVQIQNFYGIEINDFAVSVARTAMWIAENQMLEQTKDTVYYNKDFLPLDSNDSIYEGNALRMEWSDIVKPYELNYIMGNPPFIGARMKDTQQSADIKAIFHNQKGCGDLDYVAAWYMKTGEYINNSSIHCAFVSTNSISQGQQPAILWTILLSKYKLVINFAYRTFIWNNEAKHKANVHVVIIGFSQYDNDAKQIYHNGNIIAAHNINPYLLDAPNILIDKRNTPLDNSLPKMGIGNKPVDGGNYLFTKTEMEEFINKEPNSKPFFKKYWGSREFIKRSPRFCLWLGGATPQELRKMKLVLRIIERVRKFRLASKSAGTRKLAEKPTRFHVENMPQSNFLVVPRVSSQRRKYIPIGFMNNNDLASDALLVVPNVNLYEFGIMNSTVHMSWVKNICGRLKSDYRYSANIVYNNFPWPTLSDEQKQKISETAQAILDARNIYPDSSLADLYDPLTMPVELRRAHEENDKAVLKAYGLKSSVTEQEIVQRLFEMYEELTKTED